MHDWPDGLWCVGGWGAGRTWRGVGFAAGDQASGADGEFTSWLNLVERWLAELTQTKLKRGVHRSVHALEGDIRAWLADWNEHPAPFAWTKTADEILDEVAANCRRIPDSDH